ATAPKSNSVYAGIAAASADVKAGKTGSIPRELQNVHADTTGQEREQGYNYPHDYPGHWVRQQYLPDELKQQRLWHSQPNPSEDKLRAQMQKCWGDRFNK
ncbi:MAG: replication-associated recombination protein A, partial [Bacteroidaceae bacterium]|nr:replication-associated recombination protein A [Bacteroidaceae bacterium]